MMTPPAINALPHHLGIGKAAGKGHQEETGAV
jgi:hypothetical protein